MQLAVAFLARLSVTAFQTCRGEWDLHEQGLQHCISLIADMELVSRGFRLGFSPNSSSSQSLVARFEQRALVFHATSLRLLLARCMRAQLDWLNDTLTRLQAPCLCHDLTRLLRPAAPTATPSFAQACLDAESIASVCLFAQLLSWLQGLHVIDLGAGALAAESEGPASLCSSSHAPNSRRQLLLLRCPSCQSHVWGIRCCQCEGTHRVATTAWFELLAY